MYGTVARIRVTAGKETQLLEHMRQYQTEMPPGAVATAVFRADSGDGTYWLAAIFDSKESYRANAGSPEQGARYREFRSFLDSDPEWNDGEVVQRVTGPGA